MTSQEEFVGNLQFVSATFPGMSDDEVIRRGQRLREARERAGFTRPKDVIDRHNRRGVKSSYYQHEKGSVPFSFKYAQLYAGIFGVSAEWLYSGKGPMIEGETNPNDGRPALSPPQSILEIPEAPVIGTVEAGAWREAVAIEHADEFYRIQPHPGFPSDRQFLMRVSGPSCNRVVRDGGRVLVVPYELIPGGLDALTARAEPPLVIFERERAGAYEYTMKALKAVGGRIELHPVSDHPAHQSRIVLDENGDTNHVRVAYVVLEVINPVF